MFFARPQALRDLDFEVRDKLFLEKVMDIEFQDTSLTDKAVFYTDSSHSFDSVLLYGHEFSLTVFDMVLFVFVDLIAQDFLLAGIITYFVAEVPFHTLLEISMVQRTNC